MKPLVHYIGGKATFLSLKNSRRKVTLTYLTVQPFARSIADFKIRAEPLHVLYHRPIQVGHANFETMRHGELVGIHAQLIGERRADFKKLKAAKLIGILHLRQQFTPEID